MMHFANPTVRAAGSLMGPNLVVRADRPESSEKAESECMRVQFKLACCECGEVAHIVKPVSIHVSEHVNDFSCSKTELHL